MVMIKMIIRTPRTPNVIQTLQSGLEDNLSGTERENMYYSFSNKDENNNNDSKTHPNSFTINMTQIFFCEDGLSVTGPMNMVQ